MEERETIEIEVDREDIVKALEHKGLEVNEEKVDKLLEEVQLELECQISSAIEDCVYMLEKEDI